MPRLDCACLLTRQARRDTLILHLLLAPTQTNNFLVSSSAVENRRRDAFNTALNNYNCACNLAASAAFGTAPTCLSTISPFLKINKVGMLRIP